MSLLIVVAACDWLAQTRSSHALGFLSTSLPKHFQQLLTPLSSLFGAPDRNSAQGKSHTGDNMVVCRYYQQGTCRFGGRRTTTECRGRFLTRRSTMQKRTSRKPARFGSQYWWRCIWRRIEQQPLWWFQWRSLPSQSGKRTFCQYVLQILFRVSENTMIERRYSKWMLICVRQPGSKNVALPPGSSRHEE
jgi:hypothetical protein